MIGRNSILKVRIFFSTQCKNFAWTFLTVTGKS